MHGAHSRRRKSRSWTSYRRHDCLLDTPTPTPYLGLAQLRYDRYLGVMSVELGGRLENGAVGEEGTARMESTVDEEVGSGDDWKDNMALGGECSQSKSIEDSTNDAAAY
jgi:hypothetical protein